MNNLNDKSTKSFFRLWRQISFIPVLHNYWLNNDFKTILSKHVASAEKGHRGEIVLIIEDHLPIKTAYFEGCRARAINLFSQYRVWDTEENTGVLVYINICEKNLQIISDRGINKYVSLNVWEAICDKAISQIAKKQIDSALINLLNDIGQLLRQYYNLEDDPQNNELSNTIVHLS